MVWCGVVWCGVVWCGVVWCGVVWCGVVWCGGCQVNIYLTAALLHEALPNEVLQPCGHQEVIWKD